MSLFELNEAAGDCTLYNSPNTSIQREMSIEYHQKVKVAKKKDNPKPMFILP